MKLGGQKLLALSLLAVFLFALMPVASATQVGILPGATGAQTMQIVGMVHKNASAELTGTSGVWTDQYKANMSVAAFGGAAVGFTDGSFGSDLDADLYLGDALTGMDYCRFDGFAGRISTVSTHSTLLLYLDCPEIASNYTNIRSE